MKSTQAVRQMVMGEKEQRIKAISRLIDEVKPYLIEAGYKQSGIAFNGKRTREAEISKLEDATHWLVGFKIGFCSKVDQAKQLVPPSVWEMYHLTGHKGSWEQQQLAGTLEMIRLEWKKRPFILRKDASPDVKILKSKK